MNQNMLEKAQYLLSREQGTVFKDPGGKISIVLAYPNTYSIGMSSLGFQMIYGLLNDINDIVCERVFLPPPEDVREYERTGTELFSLESKRSLTRFNIIAFSVSFENDYPNILKMLRMSNIPQRSAARDESHPLLIMGGVCSFYNPEPLAEFFDVCFVGEAEEMLPEFLNSYRASQSREDLLKKITKIEGIYVPKYYSLSFSESTGQLVSRRTEENAPAIVVKRTVQDISKLPFRLPVVTPEAEFSNMCLLEVIRGCPWSCRFCVAGHVYRPARKKDLNVLEGDVRKALSVTGRVGLIGPSLSDYPHATEVLSIEGVDFSITSLRASPGSAHLVRSMRGHKSVSIAPEAGSERLRKVINKKVTEDDIMETARLILSSDIETLRLYFMIGLPTETIKDIEAIVGLVSGIRANSKKGFITLSVSTFVPKPFTPFQWHFMAPLKEVREKLQVIRKGLLRLKGVRVFHDVPKYAYMQGLFALGDRRVSSFVEEVSINGFAAIKKKAGDIGPDFYVFRKKDFTKTLQWDFIDAGVSKDRLWNEYELAVGA